MEQKSKGNGESRELAVFSIDAPVVGMQHLKVADNLETTD